MAFTLKRTSAKLNKAGYILALQYGLIAAVILCLISIICNALGYKTGEPHLLIHDIVLFGIMIWAAIVYKKKQESFLSMRQAYILCVCIGLIASIGFGVWIWANLEYIKPDYVQLFVERQENIIASSDISDIERHEQLAAVRQATPLWLAFKSFAEMLMASVFVPLFLSIFLKNEKK